MTPGEAARTCYWTAWRRHRRRAAVERFMGQVVAAEQDAAIARRLRRAIEAEADPPEVKREA